MSRVTRHAIRPQCFTKAGATPQAHRGTGRTGDSPYELSVAQGLRKKHQGWSRRAGAKQKCFVGRGKKPNIEAAETEITQTPSTHLSKSENSNTATVTRASGRSQSKLKREMHPSVVPPRYQPGKGESSSKRAVQSTSMTNLQQLLERHHPYIILNLI